MSSISIQGSTCSDELEAAHTFDAHATAARVFDHLANAILGTDRKSGRARAGKMLVLNRGHDDASAAGHSHSSTNVHMGSDGRVLKVVALGRQDMPRAPTRVSFSEDSVRAAVAKLKFSEPAWAETSTSPAQHHDKS